MLRTVALASFIALPLSAFSLPGHLTKPAGPIPGSTSVSAVDEAEEPGTTTIRVHEQTGAVEFYDEATNTWVPAEAVSLDDPRLADAVVLDDKGGLVGLLGDVGTNYDVGGGVVMKTSGYGYVPAYGYRRYDLPPPAYANPCVQQFAYDPCASPCVQAVPCAAGVPYYQIPASPYVYAPPVRRYVAPSYPYVVRPRRVYRATPHVIYRYRGPVRRW